MIDSIPPSPHPTRLVELDALRGLAALAVLLFHFTTRYQAMFGHVGPLDWGVPWGHHGVTLFFAISGFVIFFTLNRTRMLADFAVSRLSRLYPAYWAAILLTTAFVWFSGDTDRLRAPSTILVNLTMLQSFLRVPAVDDVYWTLAIELAFYGVMATIWRLGLFRRIDGVLALWLLLPWIWTYAPAYTGQDASWLLGLILVQAQIPAFAIGIAAYRLRGGQDALPAWGVVLFALLTVAGCHGAAAFGAMLVVTCAILLVALRGWSPLRWPPLVWLGTISYSLYLLHQVIGHLMIGGLEARGWSPTTAILFATLATMLLAAAVTELIERPALRLLRTAWANRKRDRHANDPVPAPLG